MRCFLLAAALVACVAGVALEDAKTAEVHKKTKKHHTKHHGKHTGKHHHHHHGHKHHHKHDAGHVDAKHADAKHAVTPEAIKAAFGPEQGFGTHPVDKTPVKAMDTTKAAGVVSHLITAAKPAEKASVAKVETKAGDSEDSIVKKMKALEAKLEKKKAAAKVDKQGQILVNGPLPVDFQERFAQAVGQATGADASKVKITNTKAQGDGTFSVTFMGSPKIVNAVETQATDPDSKIANGQLHSFLVSDGDDDEENAHKSAEPKEPKEAEIEEPEPAHAGKREVTPVEQKGIDIDTAMPYGDLEPFGREDTAQELTEDSVKESDEMVDQLERAEVAEEKRSVFRALTRLRGAAITSFDGVARSQTGNIDEYNKIHQWRTTHPLHHLADEESDISKWAFPDNADF